MIKYIWANYKTTTAGILLQIALGFLLAFNLITFGLYVAFIPVVFWMIIVGTIDYLPTTKSKDDNEGKHV